MIGLTGFIDPHVHAAPEHIPRLLNDTALARRARDAGMAGLLIKSHTTLTADRAVIAQQVVQGIRIWGGLVLNYRVGGFNSVSVEVALQYRAAEIWRPTIDAENHRRNVAGGGEGLAPQSKEFPDRLSDILNLIAKHDVILGTGHLSVEETSTLARLARQHGVKKIFITMFERTWVFTTPALGSAITPDRLIRDIKEVGFESTVLATDMGKWAIRLLAKDFGHLRPRVWMPVSMNHRSS
ncbi:MAG: DUF6282 family protein [Candidatus Sulfotelmatobacter sp.]